MFPSLNVCIMSIFELYGHRNAMYLRGDIRAMYLDDRVRSFFKKIRKEETDKNVLAHILASMFSRTLAYADSFVDIPLVRALCEKYPSSGCAYCGGKPCICDPNRKGTIVLAYADRYQMEWDVNRWVDHMHEVYGANNRNAGIYFAICRLNEEIDEAKAAHYLDEISNPNITLPMRRMNIAREFADVLAWIFSIAAMLDLNLGSAIQERYGGSCSRCTKRPCECGSPFELAQRANPVEKSSASSS